MKRYLLVAALVMASASVMARDIEASGDGRNDAYACESAKKNAKAQYQEGEQPFSYYNCICNRGTNGSHCYTQITLETNLTRWGTTATAEGRNGDAACDAALAKLRKTKYPNMEIEEFTFSPGLASENGPNDWSCNMDGYIRIKGTHR